MEGEHKSNALTIIAPIATLIIGAIIGFVIGAGQTGSSNPEVARLQAQIDAAKKFFPSMPEMHTVTGTIKSISGDSITIESANTVNPFETLPTERVVTVMSGTKFVSFEQKDQATFQKEMADFSKNSGIPRSGSVAPIMPPMPFIEKNINRSDLKVGMIINAEANENIKEKASFVAVKITVTPVMAPMVPPAPQAR